MPAPGASSSDGSTADRLLTAAAHLFRRKGFDAATTRELAEIVGVERATLYHHMRSKDELLERLCLVSLERLASAIEAVPADEPDRLRRVIITHLTVALADHDLHATMLLEHNSLPAERRAVVEEHRDGYEELLREAVLASQADGRLRSDLSAKHLTQALLNILNWTLFWYDPAGEDTPQELAARFAEIFLRGAETR